MKVAILGTGISSLGFLAGLDTKHIKVDCYDFNGKDIFQHNINKSPTILYSNEKGGLSNYWHGVMPAYLFKDEDFQDLWKKLDRSVPEISNSNEKIFIMNNPIRSKNYFKEIKSIDSYNINKLKEKYDYIFLGLGVFGNSKVLNINYGLNDFTLNDHIVNYSSFDESYDHEVELFRSGYSRKISRKYNKILIPRTAIGIDKNNFREYLSEKFSYSTSTRNIIKNIFQSKFVFSRISEAIDNKFGLVSNFLRNNIGLIYEQQFKPEIYSLKIKKKKYILDVNSSIKKNELSSIHYSMNIDNTIRENLINEGIILQPSCDYLNYFHSYHSDHQTMKSMLYAYKISRNI